MRSTPCSARYVAAGVSGLMLPAGLMWSVVTESPSLASTRAPAMSVTGDGSGAMPSKYGGLRTYVESSVPREGVARRRRQGAPVLVAGEDVGVARGEHVGVDRTVDRWSAPRPATARCRAGRPGCRRRRAERVGRDVDVHGARERVGDDQRRRREVVHLDVGVDAALEVAVAREHRHDGEVVVVDGGADLLRQRPGVADAGGAAVADEVEAQLLEVGRQARLVVVVGDDLGPGRQRRLDPRLAGEARSTAFFASRPAPIITDGFEVFVQEVIAAMTTAPCPIVTCSPSISKLDGALGFRGVRRQRSSRKASRASERITRSCGRFGPASDGTTVAEVEREQLGVRSARSRRRARGPGPWCRPRRARSAPPCGR